MYNIQVHVPYEKQQYIENTLQLNDNKTEILLTGSAVGAELPSSLPERHYIFQGTSVTFLTASSHWRGRWTNCHLVYLEIGRIGSIRQYLSFKDTKIPTLSFPLLFSVGFIVGTPSLLALISLSLMKSRVINRSVHLICKSLKSAHVTPLIFDLHCLQISSRIQYKIALICFHVFV